jgi:hypothetical protein
MVAPTTIGAGWTVGPGWRIGPQVLLTTTAAQNYAANGPTMATFRVLNRGGNWDEFFASWTDGTWSCVEIPGSMVTDMYDPGDDSPVITITGGTFVLNNFYSFQGYQ